MSYLHECRETCHKPDYSLKNMNKNENIINKYFSELYFYSVLL